MLFLEFLYFIEIAVSVGVFKLEIRGRVTTVYEILDFNNVNDSFFK